MCFIGKILHTVSSILGWSNGSNLIIVCLCSAAAKKKKKQADESEEEDVEDDDDNAENDSVRTVVDFHLC